MALSDEDRQLVEALSSDIEALVLHAQTAQALADLMPLLSLLAERAAAITTDDPELVPEIRAAVEFIGEAGHAITRAFEFSSTRLSVKLEGQ